MIKANMSKRYSTMLKAFCISLNRESGNGMRGMIGMQGIRVEMRGIMVLLRGTRVGMREMQGMMGMRGKKVGMRGIRVEIRGMGVGSWGMRGIRMGMR